MATVGPRTVVARTKGILVKAMYAVYMWSFKDTQDVFAVSERIVEYPFAVKMLRGLPRQSRVAVVGCHGDLLTTILASLDLRVAGIDVKDFPLSYNNFSFYKQDIRKLDFDADYFDAVVAISTIEHVGLFDGDPDGDRKAVAEVIRTLKPGGLLVLTVPFGSRYLEIPMRQRIYDASRLRELVKDFEMDSLTTYAYRPSSMWSEVPLSDVPEPGQYTTECTALVSATKPQFGFASPR